MRKLEVTRRGVLQSAAAMATITALGIKPGQVLAADEGVLKVRMVQDIQILDPGYMIGGAETTILYACMPRLAVPVKGDNGDWGWKPSDYVEKITQDDPTHISFTLKQGLMWSDNLGEAHHRRRQILLRAHAEDRTGARAGRPSTMSM